MTLIRPQLLTIKNSFQHASVLERLRTLLFVAACILLGYTTYSITGSLLRHHPLRGTSLLTTVFTPLLNVVCVTALATGIISALNTLFLGRDIDTILSAPISRSTFLAGKVVTLISHIGWSICIVGFPPILAYGVSLDAPLLFFLVAPLLCLLLLAQVIMTAVIIALLVAACIPQQRGRYLLIVASIIAITATTGYIGTLPQFSLHHITISTLKDTFSHFESSAWYPSVYVTHGILAAATGNWPSTGSDLAILTAIVTCTWTLLLVLDKIFYQRGLAMCQTTRPASIIFHHPITRCMARIVFPRAPASSRAIISKEYRSFARDLVHAAQLGLIITLSLFFLTFFRVLERPRDLNSLLPEHDEILLLACNIFLSSFVVLSICARFVFPSISLERDNFWILQSAPITPKHILHAKCQGWFLPLALIAMTISCSGAMALGTNHTCILISGLVSVVMTYGLVGLGIGIGAVYKQSTWEYAAQLGTSIGSFIFMGLGLLGLSLQTIPVILLFSLHADQSHFTDVAVDTSSFSVGILLFLMLLNTGIRTLSLRVGARVIR